MVNIRDDSGSRRKRSLEGRNQAQLMFEVGSLDQSELGARSGGFGDDELGIDELLAIQNTIFETRTVCKES